MHRLAALIAATGAATLVGLVAVPALGAPTPAAAPAPPTCPPAAAAGAPVAGYTLSTLATGLRYQVNSPGLLPVGDATEGNVTEADVPFARITISQGPLVDAVSSPAYPGDTAAHLGTAVATFGGPPTPNDPVLAEASFPPSPGHGADATFNSAPAGGGVATGAGSAHSTAGATGGSAAASAASSSVTGAGAPALSAGSSTATSTTDVAAGCVDAVANSAASTIEIGGLIKIEGVSGTAAARSDGRTGVPHASLTVGRVTVAGLDARIDRTGIHLNAQQPVGAGVVDQVQSLLQRTLSAAKLTVHLIDPATTVTGATASADSGGVAIDGDRVVPPTGVPGLPALSVPGAPPVPLGTPPVPLHIEAVYGAARVSVAATTAEPAGDLGGIPAIGADVTPAAPSSGSASPPPTPSGLAPADQVIAPSGPAAPSGPGTTVLSAGPAVALPRGLPVPIALVIGGILASLVAVGPLLGYARWQLLEGRRMP